MNKRVLIINGHPDTESFNQALFNAYLNGARSSNAEVKTLHIDALNFNPVLAFGYRKRTSLEPDLTHAIDLIKWCDHMVWIHPLWWYSLPAKLKGFIDRVFLPGIMYQPQPKSPFPKKLLKGKTARIITTADAPYWYYRLVMKQPATHQLKTGTLKYCGVERIQTNYFAPVRNSSLQTRNKWLKKIEKLGSKAA